MRKILNKKGFTLIELLIVIAIIAIIAGVVFVALDPLTRFQDSRDSRRWADVTALISAAKVHQVDNDGSYLGTIGSLTVGEVYMITDGIPGSPDCDAQNIYCGTNVTTETVPGDHCADLSGLVTAGYIGTIPVSPNGAGSWSSDITGYTIELGANGLLTIRACEAENTSEIWAVR
jgi:prepilin-type N-terminal cleavage/methylation domain-containing protein